MRFNLSIAIVVMVKSRHPRGQEVNRDGEYVRSNRSLMVSTESCPVIDSGNSSNVSLNARVGDFDWDESTVGFVLGSFFWGYTVTMFPGGLLAQRFGGKWPFGIAQLLSALAGMLIPVAAYAGPKFLAALRIFQGLFGVVDLKEFMMLKRLFKLNNLCDRDVQSRLVTYSLQNGFHPRSVADL